MVLNLLCSRLMEKDNSHLLEVFFNVQNIQNGEKNSPKFLIFSILVEFLHRDGLVGQHARDALLLVMSLSKKHEEVGRHIAKHTNFCPVRIAFRLLELRLKVEETSSPNTQIFVR
jgi:hypothetical protein